MEKIENNYNTINNSNDIDYLIDLFYEQINTESPLNALPICIKVVNRIKNMKKEYNNEEKQVFLELDNLYVFCMSEINRVLLHLKYETDTPLSVKEIDGLLYLGFDMISKKCKQDNDVKEYIARKMIKDIFNDSFPNNSFNIEEDLHLRFDSKDKINRIGVNNCILEIISSYDPNLGNYASCHICVFDEVKNKIKKIVDDYDDFEKQNEERKYKYLIEDVTDFCKENNMNPDENLFKLAAEYKVLDKVIEYHDNYTYLDYNNIKEMVISSSREDITMDYIHLRKMVKQYLDMRFVTRKLSEIEEDSLESILVSYVSNIENMTKEESIKKEKEILDNIKTNKEFDFAMEYLANNQERLPGQILKFKKKR